MSLLDGTKDELTAEDAFIAMAERISWPTEAHQAEVVAALRKRFDMELPAPDVAADLQDSRDVTLRNYEAELETLRADKAKADADAAELEQLRQFKADKEAQQTSTRADDGKKPGDGHGKKH